jgi:dynamin 1-like protein
MGNVVSNKQERERKRLIQDERERRERRRMKELGANGTETPIDEDDETSTVQESKADSTAVRKHASKIRSMSPAIRENGAGGLSSTLNGRGASPSRFNHNTQQQQSASSAKDSFLNYFFGKDGPGASSFNPSGGSGNALPHANIGRHVSQMSEPTFSQSIRTVEKPLRSPVLSLRPDEDFAMGLAKAPPFGADFVCFSLQ